jgi:hypothetical protein
VESTYMGYAVGRWESDTLVLDSISFVDTTWLGRGGFVHSSEMRVVEKFTRKGNEILYEVTVEDPEVLDHGDRSAFYLYGGAGVI